MTRARSVRTSVGDSVEDSVALGRAVDGLRAHLAKISETRASVVDAFVPPVQEGSALHRVVERFGLTPFETSILLLAVGVELLPGFDRVCGSLSPTAEPIAAPTFALALAVLPDPQWAALTPAGALRRYRLIELEPGPVLTGRAIRIDERVLHALLGHDGLDERVARRAEPIEPPEVVPPGHAALTDRLVATDLVHLVTHDTEAALAIVGRAAADAGRAAWVVAPHDIPDDAAEREVLAALWSREARLSGARLAFLVGAATATGPSKVLDALRRTDAPRVVIGPDAVPIPGVTRVAVPGLSFDERLEQWRGAVPAAAADTEVLRELSAQFALSPAAVATAVAALPGDGGGNGEANPKTVRRALWDACRAEARPRLAELAQPVDVRPGARRLVLPPRQQAMLDALVAQVRRRAVVHYGWGFADLDARGGGTSAVFAGPSGTGKTMAAEILAERLGLDLFRIDLSAVVSKYIGETEENLRAVFDAAESGGAILLFDEADALFGKRTEVRDSHDRHANIEVSYLLQRMEAYRGLAILTTNFRKSIDDAFLRRVQFIIDFPFPDAAQRQEIWQGIFPDATPCDGLDFAKLARLSVAGGNIRSIARNAAYLAADAERAVGMGELLEAARLEYAKLGRTLSPKEVQGWSNGVH